MINAASKLIYLLENVKDVVFLITIPIWDNFTQNKIKEKIYQSYFIDGLNIGDINILVNIAKEFNIQENDFKDFINDNNIQRVHSKISIAREKNISGVPFFEIGKDFISGAQSSIQLENVIKANLN